MNEFICWSENLTLLLKVIAGLVVSLAFGHIAARTSHYYLWENYREGGGRKYCHLVFWGQHIPPLFKRDETWKGGVPQWLMGMVERLFFTIVVGFGGVAVGAGSMVAWLGLKVALNWKRRGVSEENGVTEITVPDSFHKTDSINALRGISGLKSAVI